MSKDPDRLAGSTVLARLAQRRTRANAEPARAALPPQDIEFVQVDGETERSEERDQARQTHFYVDGFPVPRSFGSRGLPSVDRIGGLRGLRLVDLKGLALLVVVGGLASIVTLVVLDMFPRASSSGSRSLAATVSPQSTLGKSNQMRTPSQQVIDRAPSGVEATVPLNASLRGALEGTNLTVAGVPAGTTVSPGRQLKSGLWQIEDAQLGSVTVHPPPGFNGRMKLVLELRRADGTIVDRQPVRLDWVGTSREQASAGTRQTSVPIMAAPARAAINLVEHTPVTPLNQHEISVLVDRGAEYLKAGQIAAARLVLQRAADAHDPRGTLMLGATYDPIILERVGVFGLTANAETARVWYEKAKEFGSSEAPRRIEMLASWSR